MLECDGERSSNCQKYIIRSLEATRYCRLISIHLEQHITSGSMTAAVDEHEPNPKRRKLFSEDSSARPPSNIESAKDLAKVVTFEQDTDLARQSE